MDSLCHYGILGMKWGIRRTPEQLGHRRPSKTKKQLASENKKRRDSKNRGTLTNEQLRAKIERLQLEKQLRELTDGEVDSGKRYVQQILRTVGTKTLTTALSGAALYAVKAAVSGDFNPQELGSAIFNGGPKKK